MAKEPAAPRELTGEEAAVYDRQIRLWGLDAQRRLAASTVLITGAANSMLAQELAKNLVLAGVASLTFAPAAACGGGGGFLGRDLPAAVAALVDINPLVAVTVLDDAAAADVAAYSLVCAVDAPEAAERATAAACRAAGVPFQCGRAPGPVGFFFVDLGERYRYTVRKAAPAPGSRKATEAETEAAAAGEEVEEEAEAAFVSYADAVDAPWGNEAKRTDCGWHMVEVLRAFEREHGRLPGGQEGDEAQAADVTKVDAIYKELQAQRRPKQVNEALATDLGRTACYVLPPVAAVVGGMWGREAIKVVSRRDPPLDNFFFYSSRSSQGGLEKIGAGPKN